LLDEFPDAIIDVAEIEPSLLELSQKYFQLPDTPRLRNHVEDGRRMLQHSDKKYDLIFADAYYSFSSIPSHLITQEFFSVAKERLNNGGVFIANVIGDLSSHQLSFTMSAVKTFQQVFPNSYFFGVESPSQTDPQNIIFVGYNSFEKINPNDPVFLQNPDPVIQSLHKQMINIDQFNLSPHPILTDNFSPVEYLIAKSIETGMRAGN